MARMMEDLATNLQTLDEAKDKQMRVLCGIDKVELTPSVPSAA